MTDLNPVSELEPLSVNEEASWRTEPWGTMVDRVMLPLSGHLLLTEWVGTGEKGSPDCGVAEGQVEGRAWKPKVSVVKPCHFPAQGGW